MTEVTRKLISEHGATLLRLTAASIEHGLEKGKALAVDRERISPDLFDHGASFITLKRNGDLRGCIGTAQAHRPLAVDVAENGYGAAFRDSRFPALTLKELDGLSLSVSVLSTPETITVSNEDDLLARLRPGLDGLIIEDQGRRALFLPSVWEALPSPEKFLGHLKAKAGLPKAPMSGEFKSWRFIAESVSTDDPETAGVSWGTNLI